MEEEITNIPESPTQNVESERDPDRVNGFKIPDGGWGWVVCFAGFMTNFTVGGLISSGGIFLLGLMEIYDDPISKTAMVKAIFVGTLMSVGKFAKFMQHETYRKIYQVFFCC